MHLTGPLEALVATDRACVLIVLDRAGQPLSGRTIAALTDTVSQPTVSRLLRELVRQGLVLKVPGGYVINREHLAYPALDALFHSSEELARRVAAAVTGWDEPPVSVLVFGSAARNEAGPSSDIDLLVVRPADVGVDDPSWAQNVADLGEQVQTWTGLPCEILEYDPTGIRRLAAAHDPLVDALLDDGVTLAGEDLTDVIARSRR
jgi:predicted nucleotidyltransferase